MMEFLHTASNDSISVLIGIGVFLISFIGALFKLWRAYANMDKRVALGEERIGNVKLMEESFEKRMDKTDGKIEKLSDMIIQLMTVGQHNVRLTHQDKNK